MSDKKLPKYPFKKQPDKKKPSYMKKMMFIIYDEEEGEKPGDPQGYGIHCPGCKKAMEDFNIKTNVFECKCGLDWKLTFTPVGKRSIKKTTVKGRKNE